MHGSRQPQLPPPLSGLAAERRVVCMVRMWYCGVTGCPVSLVPRPALRILAARARATRLEMGPAGHLYVTSELYCRV